MSILIGVGVAATVGVIYVGRKGWYALHKAVGITPGVVDYYDRNKPLETAALYWETLKLNKKHLTSLNEQQLSQLIYIDEQVGIFEEYEYTLNQQQLTPVVDEEKFVLQKLLYTRLPEMLASHYLVFNSKRASNAVTERQAEANELLQDMLDTIEKRLASLLYKVENQNLQDLRAMKQYVDSQS